MIAFRNGRFLPYSELAVAPHDAGFVFGATVTDFCRTYRHRLFRWPDHLARLRRDAAACFIPLPYSDDELSVAAEHLVSENAKGLPPDDDLALITFATPGPLGYMAGEADTGPPTVAMHTFPIPKERYRRFFTEGVVLEVAGIHPEFDHIPARGAKHRSRIHWWVTGRMSGADVVPALMADGDTPDTAVGGVLSVHDGRIEYPPHTTALDSISIRVVLELAKRLGISVRERYYGTFHRQRAHVSELLLAGSAFGVAGVREIRDTGKIEYQWPGPVFTKLAAAWSDLVGVDIVKQFTG